jgi:hypothetical protein
MSLDPPQPAREHRLEGRGPLVSDIDIWRTAAEMLKGYSDTADIEAAARADALQDKGDLEGQRVWLRVLKAIDELQKVQPGETAQ